MHPLLEVDGEIVSSSHIRGLVLAGEVAEATRLARRSPFELRGEVVHGDERGRELGFPTANLVPDDALVCPGHGVYACLGQRQRPAAVSIGVRPTFRTGRGELIEAYLVDFDGDLYGSELTLDFLARLRGERRFESAKALVEQMHADVARGRARSLRLGSEALLVTGRRRPGCPPRVPATVHAMTGTDQQSASARSPPSSAPESRTPATPRSRWLC